MVDPNRAQTLNSGESDAQRVAAQAALAMWNDDDASQALGMQLISVEPGQASMQMPVRKDMTNGLGMCHGGYIFLLADSTFAFACNSHNQRAVAASAEIHFLSAANRDDVLTATGMELHRAGRSGVYDVRVTDQNEKLIAVFRGKSATIRGEVTATGSKTK